jgi:uroporphyrinogen-III synthase
MDDYDRPDFAGLSVLLLESRRSTEMATLVTTFGGRPLAAPAVREVAIDSNHDARAFVDALVRDEFDIVVLLTGVGTRALLDVAAGAGARDAFVAALARTKVVARGPKPLAVLRELGIAPWVTVPEPNTWRELLEALDAKAAGIGASQPDGSLTGRRVAVQEYGTSNTGLLDGLAARGARVTPVPVYRWELPEDTGPLRAGVEAIAQGTVDVVMFTTSVQVSHLLRMADSMQSGDAVRNALRRMVVASIGPSTTAELRRHGLDADMEPSHPKMGVLVREAAEQARRLLQPKRGTS